MLWLQAASRRLRMGAAGIDAKHLCLFYRRIAQHNVVTEIAALRPTSNHSPAELTTLIRPVDLGKTRDDADGSHKPKSQSSHKHQRRSFCRSGPGRRVRLSSLARLGTAAFKRSISCGQFQPLLVKEIFWVCSV